MDMNSAQGELQIDVDTETYHLTIKPALQRNLPKRWQNTSADYVRQLSDINPVDKYRLVPNDYFGTENDEAATLPGPFGQVQETLTINIDPRILD